MSWRLAAGLMCGVAAGAFEAARRPLVASASTPSTPSSDGSKGKPAPSSVMIMTNAELERLPHVKTWGVPWVEDWDNHSKRGASPSPPETKGKKRSGPQRQILLIRHGQYQNESSDDDSVRTLTPLGIEQAKRTGVFLRESMESSPLFVARTAKHFVASDLVRAQETAEHMLTSFAAHQLTVGGSSPSAIRKPNLLIDSLLREKFPCDPSPAHSKKASTQHMRLSEEAFSKYFHRPLTDENSVEVVVCHANVIRYMILRAMQLPPEAWLRFSLPHCSITSVTISSNGHVKVHAIGSFTHLPPEMQTTRNIS